MANTELLTFLKLENKFILTILKDQWIFLLAEILFYYHKHPLEPVHLFACLGIDCFALMGRVQKDCSRGIWQQNKFIPTTLFKVISQRQRLNMLPSPHCSQGTVPQNCCLVQYLAEVVRWPLRISQLSG